MKLKLKALIILSVVAVSMIHAPAFSQEGGLCQKVSKLAHLIMSIRQQGIPLSTVLGKLSEIGKGGSVGGSKEPGEAVRLMVIDAYERPMMRMEENKEAAIIDFENKYSLMCYKTMREAKNGKQ